MTRFDHNLAEFIDHTLLKPEATEEQIQRLCQEAIEYDFASVCISPAYVSLAKKALEDSAVGLCTVVGFPLGAHCTSTKVHEATLAISQGATEIDMVIHIGALKSGHEKAVQTDIEAVREASQQCILKVILETALLSTEEIAAACRLASQSGADYVKTSTGFSHRGASLDDIAIMKQNIANNVMIKASGGIRDQASALKFIEAGAKRLGTSAGIAIVHGSNSTDGY